MVADVLKRGIDYGRIPGTPADSLWDPGASMIISAFNCFAGERRVLKLEDNSERISVIIEVPIISRSSGRVMATGIGAASTMETKYKYRWLSDEQAAADGYNEEALKAVRTKRDPKGETLYRVANPEHSELLNTIIKMAAKRAEVDAAGGLPGVASALRQIFAGRPVHSKPDVPSGQKITTWNQFWGESKRLGLEQVDVYRILEVDHVKEWLTARGETLDGAIEYLRNNQTKAATPLGETSEIPGTESQQKHKDIPEIATVWDDCRTLVTMLKIEQKNLQTWWDQYGQTVLVDDFRQADIPSKFTAAQIQKFHESLLALSKQRANKAEAKKAKPPESML
jgi:hypothetical protein